MPRAEFETVCPHAAPCTSTMPQGPVMFLCFAARLQGDRLAVGRSMPKAEVGDYVLVADVGAYTLSMYSRCAAGVLL